MLMKRLLRFAFINLFAMICGTAFADTVEWDLTIASYDSGASEEKVTWSSSVATMIAEKDGASTKTNNYLGGMTNQTTGATITSSRFYTKSKLTIKPAAGVTINYVVFTATTDGYAKALQQSTWTNAAATVEGTTVTIVPTDGTKDFYCTLSGTSGHSKVVVHYGGETVPDTPEPEPEPDVTTYTSIPAMLAAITATKTDVAYTFENLLVTFVMGSNTYVTDGTNGFLFYGSSLGLNAGDKISGTAKGQLYTYNGLPEIAVTAANISKTVVSTGNDVSPAKITPADLNSCLNKYIMVENAILVSVNDRNLTFKVGDTEFSVYNQWRIDIEGLQVGTSYTLTGAGAIFKENYQMYLATFTPTGQASISAVTASTSSARRYNAAGQLINTSYKGLVIEKGRKYISHN